MRWFWELFAGPKATPRDDRPVAISFPSGHDHEARMVAKTREALSQAGISDALSHEGLANTTPAAVQFVREALWDAPFPKGIDIRRSGDLLSKDELRERGIRANAICSRQYYGILTEAGRADPVSAAQQIVSRLTGAHSSHVRLTAAAAAMGGNARIRVYENRMAAGPCPACIKLASKTQPISKAPTGPLEGCPHPSQCALHWHVVSDFE